jgi:hypothetical protein
MVIWCFSWGFLENGLQWMVFLWSNRGGMHGKRGLLKATFEPWKNMQECELYLQAAVEIVAAARPRPFAALN